MIDKPITLEDKKFYEKLSGKKLSDQEVYEARENFVGFFYLLHKLDIKNKEREKLKKLNKKKKGLK